VAVSSLRFHLVGLQAALILAGAILLPGAGLIWLVTR
jgi:hypothetical protein